MKARKGMATGKEAQARRAAKAARPTSLVPKATGRMLFDKDDYLRSGAHLALVRQQQCLVTRSFGAIAHHPDECFPGLVAQQKKISDYLAVPLRHDQHDPGTPGSVHKVNNMRWWKEKHVDVYRWLKNFLRRHYKPGHAGADAALRWIEDQQERERAAQRPPAAAGVDRRA